MAASFEIVNGVLFVTGSLDRSSDQDFAQALEKYAKTVAAADRLVDMSNVRWLAPTGAKALISAGQDTNEKGATLRVLASRHVLQTLNLLGAKAWLNIESCLMPNAKPGAPEPPVFESEAAGTAGQASSGAPESAAQASAEVRPAGAGGGAQTSGTHEAVTGMPVASAPPQAARALGAFASAAEELTGGAHLLRVLQPNRRYSFHLTGGELMLGIVRERIGGAWVMIETAGTRKILSLDAVLYCEIL